MFPFLGLRAVIKSKKWLLILALAGLGMAGCAPGREETIRRLRTDNPRVQVATIAQVVRAGDRTMAGELINLLESEDEGVRFVAASALHRLTGKDLGFHFARTEEERARIVSEWRTWWEKESQAACGSAPPPASPRPEESSPKENP